MELEQLPKEEKPTGKTKHAEKKEKELKKKTTTKTGKGAKECTPIPTSRSSSSLVETSRRIDQESEALGGKAKQKSLNRLLASSPESGALRIDEREVPPAATTTKSSPSPIPTPASPAHIGQGNGTHQDEETSSTQDRRSLAGEEVMVDLKGYMHVATVKRCGPKSHSTRKVVGWKNRWIHIYREDSDGEFVLEIHAKRPVAGKRAVPKAAIQLRMISAAERRDDVRRGALVLLPEDADKVDPVYLCSDTLTERDRWMTNIRRRLSTARADNVLPEHRRRHGMREEEEGFRMRTLESRHDRTQLKNKGVIATRTISNEQDQSSAMNEEEERMMREIEKHMNEIRLQHGSTAPSPYPSHLHLHPAQPPLMRQHSSQPHLFAAAPVQPSTTYNPFIDRVPSAGCDPSMSSSLSSSSSSMRMPVVHAPFRPSDLSSSYSSLPQAQTVVMSTITSAALASSPSLSSSTSSMTAVASPLALSVAPPTPHIPPPFLRQSSLLLKQQAQLAQPLSSPPSELARS